MKDRIFGVLQILFGNNIKIEPENFHYNFGSMDSYYLEIASKMIEEKKLKFYYEIFNFDKKGIVNGFQIIESRRTKGKIVYEINKE